MILTKYKEFNEGDEVYTDKKNWKLIIANKPYIVIKCYTPPGFISDCDIRVVDIENEAGSIERYDSDKFNKTIRQIKTRQNQ
jgi:hypothetical protein